MTGPKEQNIPIECPLSMIPHVVKIFDGEYAFEAKRPITKILDLGANVGAFTVWAAGVWPDSHILAFEPSAENYALLLSNTFALNQQGRVTTLKMAVTSPWQPSVRLYHGRNNSGECSLYEGIEQLPHYENVLVYDAASLPPCDLLKVDTEGCETTILWNYVIKAERKPHYVVLEYHSVEDMQTVQHYLKEDYECLSHAGSRTRGVLKYARRN